ncbi:hypothetical protein KW850_25535 [Bacillus sp. sid0103]|uniref:hypothetical protein n=1 Tax=Bacillus sp. sid0103 TaxID=2856337 RepID=UPI001C44C489|nr:hypothetical protein [Bacillus sp. sid0103]MBV7508583.1 hypothetical protein [Bacillus sp. sid0103]
MNEYQRLEKIIKITDGISSQVTDKDYDNDIYKLKRALDLTSRALGMFAKMEKQKLDGEIDIPSLTYIEARLCTAIYYVMNPTKDGKVIDSPKPSKNSE